MQTLHLPFISIALGAFVRCALCALRVGAGVRVRTKLVQFSIWAILASTFVFKALCIVRQNYNCCCQRSFIFRFFRGRREGTSLFSIELQTVFPSLEESILDFFLRRLCYLTNLIFLSSVDSSLKKYSFKWEIHRKNRVSDPAIYMKPSYSSSFRCNNAEVISLLQWENHSIRDVFFQKKRENFPLILILYSRRETNFQNTSKHSY